MSLVHSYGIRLQTSRDPLLIPNYSIMYITSYALVTVAIITICI